MKTILALCITVLAATAFSYPPSSVRKVPFNQVSETIPSVSYVGLKNEMLVFEVRFHFSESQVKTFRIFDEAGNEIHSEQIKSKAFARQYMFPKNISSKLQFVLRGKKEMMNETFNVSYKMEERLDISKA